MNDIKEWPKLSNSMRADYKAIRNDWDHVGKVIRGESKTNF